MPASGASSRHAIATRRRLPKMGALLPWRPFRDLERLARRLEAPFRFFEDLEERPEEGFLPAIESFVKNGNLVVRADVPGMEPKDIEVSILGNVLTVKGTQERTGGKEGGLSSPRSLLWFVRAQDDPARR